MIIFWFPAGAGFVPAPAAGLILLEVQNLRWLTLFRNGLGEEKYKQLGLPEPVGTREEKEIKFEKIKDL